MSFFACWSLLDNPQVQWQGQGPSLSFRPDFHSPHASSLLLGSMGGEYAKEKEEEGVNGLLLTPLPHPMQAPDEQKTHFHETSKYYYLIFFEIF